jgi:hypothetical protein
MKCSDCEFFTKEQERAYCYLYDFHKPSIPLLRTLIGEGKTSVLKVITPKRKRIPTGASQNQPSWCPLIEKGN